MSFKVFISHAHADQQLVSEFFRLLAYGMGVKTPDIFCTSSSGQGVKIGERFTEEIHKQLVNCDLSIALISPHYYQSTFCMCELGAIWGGAKRFIPILMPPLDYSDMKAVISGIQAVKADNRSDLDVLFDQIRPSLIDPISTAGWNREVNRFVCILPSLYRNPAGAVKRKRGEVFLDEYSYNVANAFSRLILRERDEQQPTEKYKPDIFLIVFDIDRMNQINTRHGVKVGDAILDNISSAIEKDIENYIEGGRCGDDTFFLIICGDDNDALNHGERILEFIRNTPKTLIDKDVWVTASAGICKFVPRCSIRAWKSRAHLAMLKARENGGNRCVIGAPPIPLAEPLEYSWGS